MLFRHMHPQASYLELLCTPTLMSQRAVRSAALAPAHHAARGVKLSPNALKAFAKEARAAQIEHVVKDVAAFAAHMQQVCNEDIGAWDSSSDEIAALVQNVRELDLYRDHILRDGTMQYEVAMLESFDTIRSCWQE